MNKKIYPGDSHTTTYLKECRLRQYDPLPINPLPLPGGEVPTPENMRPKYFTVKTKDGHLLTEKEWSDVVGDNIQRLGVSPEPKSPYRLKDLIIEDVKEESLDD